jgi:hypothetical protein
MVNAAGYRSKEVDQNKKNKPDFQPFKVAFVQTYKHPGTATVKQAMDPLFPIPYPDPYGTTV